MNKFIVVLAYLFSASAWAIPQTNLQNVTVFQSLTAKSDSILISPTAQTDPAYYQTTTNGASLLIGSDGATHSIADTNYATFILSNANTPFEIYNNSALALKILPNGNATFSGDTLRVLPTAGTDQTYLGAFNNGANLLLGVDASSHSLTPTNYATYIYSNGNTPMYFYNNSSLAVTIATNEDITFAGSLLSPTLVTPALGTPSALVLTNASGVLPVGVTGGSGLSIAASQLTNVTGSGSAMLAVSPTTTGTFTAQTANFSNAVSLAVPATTSRDLFNVAVTTTANLMDISTDSSGHVTTYFANGSNSNILVLNNDRSIQMPGIASSTAVQSGTVCRGSGGDLTYDPSLGCLSSTLDIKQNVVPLSGGLKEVLTMSPVSYQLKPQYNPDGLGTMMGFIAEDMAKVDQRLVGYGSDGAIRGVRYMQLTAVLAKAIQELQAEILKLQAAMPSGHQPVF